MGLSDGLSKLQKKILQKESQGIAEQAVSPVEQRIDGIETRVVQVESQVNAANFNYIVSLRAYLQIA